MAFAAGVLVGGAGALLLRPKLSAWRSTFKMNRAAKTLRKKEFAAIKEIYDAYSSSLIFSHPPLWTFNKVYVDQS
jgi:gas vesicle protein